MTIGHISSLKACKYWSDFQQYDTKFKKMISFCPYCKEQLADPPFSRLIITTDENVKINTQTNENIDEKKYLICQNSRLLRERESICLPKVFPKYTPQLDVAFHE